MTEEEQYQAGKAEMAVYLARREAFHAEQRALAETAVAKALASYRWWGWQNIVNTIRLAIQAWRWRRNNRA